METDAYKYLYMKCALPKLSATYRVNLFERKSLQIIVLGTWAVRPGFLKMLFLYHIAFNHLRIVGNVTSEEPGWHSFPHYITPHLQLLASPLFGIEKSR